MPRGHNCDEYARPGLRFLSPGSRRAIQAFPDAEQTGSHFFCQRRTFPPRTNTVIVNGDRNILASFLPGKKYFFSWTPHQIMRSAKTLKSDRQRTCIFYTIDGGQAK